jgi:hypothetical protein
MQSQATWTKGSNRSMSSWGAMFRPRLCEMCGREIGSAGTDWFAPWNEFINTPMMREWSRAWDDMFGTWMPPKSSGRQGAGYSSPMHEKHCDCCSRCEPDDCHCRCCVVNADLVVYARVGELRILPITIENHIRREREVELQLSDWTTHSKEAIKVAARLASESKFTLKACEERSITVMIRATADLTRDATTPKTDKQASDTEKTISEDDAYLDRQGRQLADVGECTVYYADLRVLGCDIRPIRIALAILPRDCGDYRVDCQRGCCC